MLLISQTTPRPFFWRLLLFHPKTIGCRADHQREVRFINLPLHPDRPAFRWAFVLVDGRVHAVSPEPVRKCQNAFFMFCRVVAVTCENAHGRRSGLRHRGLSNEYICSTMVRGNARYILQSSAFRAARSIRRRIPVCCS